MEQLLSTEAVATEPAMRHHVRPTASPPVSPLVKWPGGKSAELKQIKAALPPSFARYCEPFAGGGAVFFSLPPNESMLGDTSVELMKFYELVQAKNETLLSLLWSIEGWWSAVGDWVTSEGTSLFDVWSVRHDRGDFGAVVATVVSTSVHSFAKLVPETLNHLVPVVISLVTAGVPKKLLRMRKVEVDRGVILPHKDVWENIEGAYKAAVYTALRQEYNIGRAAGRNNSMQVACFFYLREYAYASMFRFNASGAFNVPYGGVSYNRKDIASKIRTLTSASVEQRLGAARLHYGDFESCIEAFSPSGDDLLFLDPPYDSDFSEYDLQPFGAEDHRRLGRLLKSVRCKILLVIKASPLIESLYPIGYFHVTAFNKTYMWTIKERNDRQATHLIITNYEPPATQLDIQ